MTETTEKKQHTILWIHRIFCVFYREQMTIGFTSDPETEKRIKKQYLKHLEEHGDPHEDQGRMDVIPVEKEILTREIKTDHRFISGDSIFVVFRTFTGWNGHLSKWPEAAFKTRKDAKAYVPKKIDAHGSVVSTTREKYTVM